MPSERPHETWSAEQYARTSRYVTDHGEAVFELLAARAGERILDLGCGDGVLTERIAASGATAVGVDGNADMVAAAHGRGINAVVMDAQELTFKSEFDAVFSNAALHWMLRPDAVLAGVHRALKPGGRFVAEFGGAGNVTTLVEAFRQVLAERGHDFDAISPWYFPTEQEYGDQLRSHGFQVPSIALLPRPTPITGDITDWLQTFAVSILEALPESEREEAVKELRQLLRPKLCDESGQWIVDYVRLRVVARLAGRSGAEGSSSGRS